MAGRGRANLAADTKSRITQYDSDNLAETYTHDFVRNVKNWIFRSILPEIDDIPVRLVAGQDEADPTKTMAAVKQAFDMGAEFAEKDVVALTGLAQPQEGDKRLSKASQDQAAAAMGQQPGGMPGMPQDAEQMPAEGEPSDDEIDAAIEEQIGGGDAAEPEDKDIDAAIEEHLQQYSRDFEAKHPPVDVGVIVRDVVSGISEQHNARMAELQSQIEALQRSRQTVRETILQRDAEGRIVGSKQIEREA